MTQDWPVVIVGIGNLGHALANFSGFRSRGFRVVALLDADPEPARRASSPVIDVRAFDDLERDRRRARRRHRRDRHPGLAAQDVADRMVAAGIRSILNFAPTVISVPDGVDVRKVDLSIELQILAYHEQRKAHAPEAVRHERPRRGHVPQQRPGAPCSSRSRSTPRPCPSSSRTSRPASTSPRPP